LFNNCPWSCSSFIRIKTIALASDLKRIESKPVEVLKEWLNIFESKLDVVNVTEDNEPGLTAVSVSISIENLLPEYNPQFYFIAKDEVEAGVDQFIEENKPDLPVVIQRIMISYRGFSIKANGSHSFCILIFLF
jgi:hypothetical protein